MRERGDAWHAILRLAPGEAQAEVQRGLGIAGARCRAIVLEDMNRDALARIGTASSTWRIVTDLWALAAGAQHVGAARRPCFWSAAVRQGWIGLDHVVGPDAGGMGRRGDLPGVHLTCGRAAAAIRDVVAGRLTRKPVAEQPDGDSDGRRGLVIVGHDSIGSDRIARLSFLADRITDIEHSPGFVIRGTGSVSVGLAAGRILLLQATQAKPVAVAASSTHDRPDRVDDHRSGRNTGACSVLIAAVGAGWPCRGRLCCLLVAGRIGGHLAPTVSVPPAFALVAPFEPQPADRGRFRRSGRRRRTRDDESRLSVAFDDLAAACLGR